MWTIEQTIRDELVYESEPCLERLHRALGARCKLGAMSSLAKEWKRMTEMVYRMACVIGTLNDAIENASEYGYSWPCNGSNTWFSDQEPCLGDDTTDEYLNPFIGEFARIYTSSCVFMSRSGQRSQCVDHKELDVYTGRTYRQEREARDRRLARKRRREEEEAMEEERRLRRERLSAVIQEAKSELASM